jgi:hypothetical protein
VFDDPRGMRKYHQPAVTSFDRLLELGRQFNQDHPGGYVEVRSPRPASRHGRAVFTPVPPACRRSGADAPR